MDAAIALLYELCVGNSSMEGVTVLISWLNHIVLHPATPSPATDDYHSLGTSQQQQQQRSPQELCVNGGVSAEVLHCIAAVLWNTPHDTTSLITDELFRYDLIFLEFSAHALNHECFSKITFFGTFWMIQVAFVFRFFIYTGIGLLGK